MPGSAEFEWDAGNLEKCRSHGVSIEEIEIVFANDPFTTPDAAHSQDEDRSIAVGRGAAGRLIFVVFTVRTSDDREIVRPISARYMHRKEIDRYVKLWQQESPETSH